MGDALQETVQLKVAKKPLCNSMPSTGSRPKAQACGQIPQYFVSPLTGTPPMPQGPAKPTHHGSDRSTSMTTSAVRSSSASFVSTSRSSTSSTPTALSFGQDGHNLAAVPHRGRGG